MKEKRKIASEARKILGFTKITKEVERTSRTYEAQDEDEAYLVALREFFKQEMRIGQDVFENLGIKKIFPPAKENRETLYVQF